MLELSANLLPSYKVPVNESMEINIIVARRWQEALQRMEKDVDIIKVLTSWINIELECSWTALCRNMRAMQVKITPTLG